MYRPTIGLEVHAELKTKTKMFCDSANDPDESRPNVNVCPVCMAHPGTLPVINQEAVRHILRIGVAIKGQGADFSEFDRKSYFYPDIPKGYQISQYEHPLVTGGELLGVAITRVHLEEDTARSTHTAGKSLVDFNRAGIPLMELVTEPVIHDALTAGRFARELQLLLRTLGASEANLEKGEMRIEANISVSSDETVFGTKVEVKNINSFRSVERAIAFEIERQIALIESGGKVVQETRGWDETKQATFHQRFKEGSADYRYFPEPDLPKLFISEIQEFSPEKLRATVPELPWDKRNRLRKEYGLKEEAVELFMQDSELGTFFETVVSGRTPDFARLAANYITTDLTALLKEKTRSVFPDADTFIKLMDMSVSNKLSSRGIKDTLSIMVEKGGLPAPRPGKFFVYVILCDDGSMYIGQTEDLQKRLDEHKKEKGAEHTVRHKPIKVIHYEEFDSRQEAVKREHDLKTGFGRKWLKREWEAGRTRQAGDPESIAKEHNLIQVHDTATLSEVVRTVITREEKAVQEYKGGKEAALQYLVGKAMKESGGAGNPESLRKLIIEKVS